MSNINSSAELFKSDLGIIPPLIKKLHPRIKIHEYESFRDNHLFLSKISLICEDCFLEYTK